MRRHLLSFLLLPLISCTTGELPADATPAWRAEEVVTIGGDSGDASFLSVRSLLFGKGGELHVLDYGSKEIKVFDPAGSFLRRIGRTGAGPGEFRDPYSLAWLGDTLALLDPGNSRIGLFGPDAQWIGELPAPRLTGGNDIRLFRGSTSFFWFFSYRIAADGVQRFFVRHPARGSQDTLPFVWPPPAGRTAITCEVPRGIRFFDAPFAPQLLEIPTPDGRRVIARTDAYRITFLGPAGDTVATIRRDEPLRLIADSAWEAGLVKWTEARKTPGIKCDGDAFDRPAGQPVLGALFYDDQGRLWVEVHGVDALRYDLYDAAGTRVATITGLPSSGDVDPAFRGDRIAIALPDDREFPRVAIFRIVTERSPR
jgi:hypothetical protein